MGELNRSLICSLNRSDTSAALFLGFRDVKAQLIFQGGYQFGRTNIQRFRNDEKHVEMGPFPADFQCAKVAKTYAHFFG